MDLVEELAEAAPCARYSATIGPLPDLADPSTWAAAWQRERWGAHWARLSGAYIVVHGVNPGAPAKAFAK